MIFMFFVVFMWQSIARGCDIDDPDDLDGQGNWNWNDLSDRGDRGDS